MQGSDDLDFLKGAVREPVHGVMGLEGSEQAGARRHERASERRDERAGSPQRDPGPEPRARPRPSARDGSHCGLVA